MENNDEDFIFDQTVQDVLIGSQEGKVRNVEIHKRGTTTWFNASSTPIVIIDQLGTITNLGNTSTTGIVSGAAGVFVANMTSASVLTGPVGCTTVTAATSVQAPLGIFASLAAPYKLFDIKHPSPDKATKRLRHGSLEGPELAVYTRGSSSEGQITLPDYWEHLVDPDTITVHLTATKPEQKLCVDVAGLNITVSGHENAKYYYHIMAERKDVAKLEIEVDSQHDYGF